MPSAPVPANVQVIGAEVAILWSDGVESYLPSAFLRARSPSAEVRGEHDIFGQRSGGESPARHEGVAVLGWEVMGNYALRFEFSDGHRTGLYTYPYLRALAAERRS